MAPELILEDTASIHRTPEAVGNNNPLTSDAPVARRPLPAPFWSRPAATAIARRTRAH